MNRDAYNKIAWQWSAARKDFCGRERDCLDMLIEATPVGATLLDLGCGSGRPMADYVVAQGRHIVGVDQSEALLEIARARLPEEEWILTPLEEKDRREIDWETAARLGKLLLAALVSSDSKIGSGGAARAAEMIRYLTTLRPVSPTHLSDTGDRS